MNEIPLWLLNKLFEELGPSVTKRELRDALRWIEQERISAVKKTSDKEFKKLVILIKEYLKEDRVERAEQQKNEQKKEPENLFQQEFEEGFRSILESKKGQVILDSKIFGPLNFPTVRRNLGLSYYFADLASARQDVQQFREDFLCGAYLSKEEAYKFLIYHPISWMNPELYISHIKSGFLEKVLEQVISEDKPEPIEERAYPLIEAIYNIESTSMRVSFSAVEDPLVLYFPGPKEGLSSIYVQPNSVGSVLQKLSSKLANYYSWRIEDAVWFILTNTVPSYLSVVPTIETSFKTDHVSNKIILEIDPSTPAETVKKVYLEYQRLILQRGSDGPRDKNLTLYIFITMRQDPKRKRRKRHERRQKPGTKREQALWRDWRKEWNKAYPNWEYEDKDEKHFIDDYYEAEERLLPQKDYVIFHAKLFLNLQEGANL